MHSNFEVVRLIRIWNDRWQLQSRRQVEILTVPDFLLCTWNKKMLFHMDYIFSYLSSASLAMFWDMFVAHRAFFADNPLIGEH